MRLKIPEVSRRGLSVLSAVGVVAFVLTVAIVGSRVSNLSAMATDTSTTVSHLKKVTTSQQALLDAQADGLAEANRRLRKAGKPQVVVPPVPGAPGRSGRPGPRGPGPSAAQVAQAVAAYCFTGVCAGHGPSASQVASAVSTYCNARGQCQGPSGPDGRQGIPGQTGSPGDVGERGPAPTDAQVLDAVGVYCSLHGDCQGPRGDQGPKGDPGNDGRDAPTIVSAAITGDITACLLSVTLSDGSVISTPVPAQFCTGP